MKAIPKFFNRSIPIILILVLTLFSGQDPGRASPPTLIQFQGILLDRNGIPVEGTASIRLSLYADDQTPTALWTELHPNVSIEGGLYTFLIGSQVPLTADLFAGELNGANAVFFQDDL